MDITIQDCSSKIVNSKYLNTLFSTILRKEGDNPSNFIISSFGKIISNHLLLPIFLQNASLLVSYMTTNQINKINTLYRNQKKPTDVLSFPERKHKELVPEDYYLSSFSLGEIFICPEIVEKYALEDSEEIFIAEKKTLIHGFLHLLGYDHENSQDEEKEMLKRQGIYAK